MNGKANVTKELNAKHKKVSFSLFLYFNFDFPIRILFLLRIINRIFLLDLNPSLSSRCMSREILNMRILDYFF